MPDTLCLLVCTIIRPEVDAVLADETWDDVAIRSFPAHCGQSPLTQRQIDRLSADISPVSRIEILGSGCLCGLDSIRCDTIHLHRRAQCFELLAPAERVTAHLDAGAYLLTPGWVRDWRKHVAEWGFVRSQARSFFKEFARQLVLLDTGIDADATRHVQDFASFVDRPHSVDPVGLETLRTALHDIADDWRSKSGSITDESGWSGRTGAPGQQARNQKR